MGDLLKSIITGVLVAIIGTMMLSELGVNIAPIIASAGIIGIALGFGAQSLVKDFLSGIFMIFEDQYGVGDVVDVGEASGTVEAVSLRVTRLRDINGTVWYVPNGEILRVGNMSQNWSRAVVDVIGRLQRGPHRVKRVLREIAHDLWDDDDFARADHRGARGHRRRDAHRRLGHPAGHDQDRCRWSSGPSPASCVSGSRPASTTRASRSRSPQRVIWHRDEQRQAADDTRRTPTRQRPSTGQRSGSGQRGVERDRGAGERLADRAARLGVLGGGDEVLLADAVDRRRARSGWMPVMPVPGTNSTSAEVSSEVGGVPALARPLENAIEKQAECAAAISSSGLVLPLGSSARAGHETSKVPRPDDSRVTLPAPSKRLPSQWVGVAGRSHADDPSTPILRSRHAPRQNGRGEHVLRRDRRLRDLPPHRREVLRGRRRRTRCSGRSTPRRTSARPRSGSGSSSCSTGAARRRTPTPAATRGCGCGTRRSP